MNFINVASLVGVTLCAIAIQFSYAEDNADAENLNFFGDLAKALIGAVFPDLRSNPGAAENLPAQKEILSAPSQGQTRQLPSAPFSIPGYLPNANPFGLGAGSAYPSSIMDTAPKFPAATNPAFQSFLPTSSGLQGRTDLPASWVYPFAPRGTVVAPDNLNNEFFALRPEVPAGESSPANLNPQFIQQTLLKIQQEIARQNAGASLVHPSLQPYEMAPVRAPKRINLDSGNHPVPVRTQKRNSRAKKFNGRKQINTRPVTVPRNLDVQYNSRPVVVDQQPNFTRLALSSRAVRTPIAALVQAQSKRATASRSRSDTFQTVNHCSRCVPIDLDRLAGPWTQIYGSPSEMKNVYSTLHSLVSLNLTDSVVTTDLKPIQPSCVGLQVSKPQFFHTGVAATNLFFRDDTNNRKLQEIRGLVRKNGTFFQLDMKLLNMPMCLVKGGPPSSTLYSYVILTRATGRKKCRSFHVFARDTDVFFQHYNSEVVHFLKQEVNRGAVPLSVLPFPELCQLRS